MVPYFTIHNKGRGLIFFFLLGLLTQNSEVKIAFCSAGDLLVLSVMH